MVSTCFSDDGTTFVWTDNKGSVHIQKRSEVPSVISGVSHRLNCRDTQNMKLSVNKNGSTIGVIFGSQSMGIIKSGINILSVTPVRVSIEGQLTHINVNTIT